MRFVFGALGLDTDVGDAHLCSQVEYYPDKAIGGFGEDMDSETECEELDGEGGVVLGEEGDADECNAVDAALVHPKIADSLANLGFYARSMKPPKAWWYQGTFPSLPFHVAIVLTLTTTTRSLSLSPSSTQHHCQCQRTPPPCPA